MHRLSPRTQERTNGTLCGSAMKAATALEHSYSHTHSRRAIPTRTMTSTLLPSLHVSASNDVQRGSNDRSGWPGRGSDSGILSVCSLQSSFSYTTALCNNRAYSHIRTEQAARVHSSQRIPEHTRCHPGLERIGGILQRTAITNTYPCVSECERM